MNDFLKPKFKEMALKYGLTQSEVMDVFYSQFKFAANVISQDSSKDFKDRRSVKIKGLGTFEFNEKKAKKITHIKKEKNERENMVETSS